jgi:hypothetical protein
MNSIDRERLVQAWLTFQRNWWSYRALIDLCEKDPDLAWPVLLRVISEAEDQEMLETIGAGPLEDVLRAHGEALVAEVEEESCSNQKLRCALGSVWLPRKDDPVTGRLVKIGCLLLQEPIVNGQAPTDTQAKKEPP